MVRPKNSSPHADHFHIRIFCTDGDLEFGCKDYGPEWAWVKEARAVDQAMLESRVDRIMRGEMKLDLKASGGALPPAAARPMSPDQLPDPPTDIPFKL